MIPPHSSTRAVPLVVFLSHVERLSSALSKPTHRMARPPERNVRAGRLYRRSGGLWRLTQYSLRYHNKEPNQVALAAPGGVGFFT